MRRVRVDVLVIVLIALLGTIPVVISKSDSRSETRADIRDMDKGDGERLIIEAIEDEIAASLDYDKARIADKDSYCRLFYSQRQPVLIKPLGSSPRDTRTHVFYPLAEVGWVMREVSVYRSAGAALFWLGYSDEGPGLNTGFNCTHSKSNCRIQDLDFETVRKSFLDWNLAWYQLLGQDDAATALRFDRAKRRNGVRESLRLKLIDHD